MAVVRSTAQADRQIMPAELLWRVDLPEYVLTAHDTLRTLSAIDIIEARDVVYGGRGLFVRSGRIHDEPGLTPSYIGFAITQYGTDNPMVASWQQGLLSPSLRILNIDTPAIVPVHPHWPFGHFLLEILPRVLLLDNECPRDWPLLLARDRSSYLPHLLTMICPERPILFFNPVTEAIRAPSFIGCSDLVTHDGSSPYLRKLIQGLRDRLLTLSSAASPRSNRIFLSRSGIDGRRHLLTNTEEIEKAVAEAGFEVIRPETLPFPEQIRLFATASVIAGQFGSALHNALFSPPATTIICLNWINPYQSQIAHLMGHRIGYIAPSDGQMRTGRVLRQGWGQMHFQTDQVVDLLTSLG